MSFDLERELQAGLRRQAPRRDLTAGVLARVRQPRPRRTWRGWITAATALVAVALVAGASWSVQARRTAQARADAQQLVAALQLASSHLERARSQIVRMSQ